MRSHIAILKKPYLELILAGKKRLECRLTKTRRVPFGKIAAGDKVLLKESGGPVRGKAMVEKVRFFEGLDEKSIREIQKEYGEQIMADDDFWGARSGARYCSLIWLKAIENIKPYIIKTKGMRAWIIKEEVHISG